MTNEEKAREISERYKDDGSPAYDFYEACLEMAAWKQKQMIKKASQQFCRQCDNVFRCQMTECTRLRSFKKAMEE